MPWEHHGETIPDTEPVATAQLPAHDHAAATTRTCSTWRILSGQHLAGTQNTVIGVLHKEHPGSGQDPSRGEVKRLVVNTSVHEVAHSLGLAHDKTPDGRARSPAVSGGHCPRSCVMAPNNSELDRFCAECGAALRARGLHGVPIGYSTALFEPAASAE